MGQSHSRDRGCYLELSIKKNGNIHIKILINSNRFFVDIISGSLTQASARHIRVLGNRPMTALIVISLP